MSARGHSRIRWLGRLLERTPGAGLNGFYALTVIVIACGSTPKGYDEGGFAGASGLDSFLRDFGLTKSGWGSPS